MNTPSLIAIDWGSTNFRALLLDAQGHCLETIHSDIGVLNCAAVFREQGFLPILTRQLQCWAAQHDALPIILAGMVGSRSGWYEVPYMETPASVHSIAAQLFKIPHALYGGAWIVPGVRGFTPNQLPDVMRGEEVQIIGALLQNGMPESALAILPGTHSKWVSIVNRYIDTFATVISGELFAILQQHGSLAPLLEGAPDQENFEAFDEGIAQSKLGGGLAHHLFTVRSQRLLGQLDAAYALQKLSGLIIGAEIASMQHLFSIDTSPIIIGNKKLSALYQRALMNYDVSAATVSGDDAFARGIISIARAANIIGE